MGTLSLPTVTTLTPDDLTSATVERSAVSQGASSIFTINFTLPGELIDGSTVRLGLPLNQIVKSSSSFTCVDGSNSNSLT